MAEMEMEGTTPTGEETPIDPGEDGFDSETTEAKLKVQLGFQLDDGEAERAITLYSASSTLQYIPRKTEPKDIPALTKYVNGETIRVFPDYDIGKLYEKSCFSLVLTDRINLDLVIAHASFTDIPRDPLINMDGKRWKSAVGLEGVTPLNTLFMSIYVYHKRANSDTCLLELICSTFKSCSPVVDFLVVECPDLEYTGRTRNYARLTFSNLAPDSNYREIDPLSFLNNVNCWPMSCRELTGTAFLFTRLTTQVTYSPKPRVKKKLIVYAKDILYPHVVVRGGREHDLDDLIPLLTMDTAETEKYFGKTYLLDLIAMSDRSNQSIVAEFDGEAVGMIAVSSDVNYNILNEHFHLEPFHGLYKPHEDDEIHVEPVASHLLERVRSSNIIIQDHFERDTYPIFRPERLSQIDFMSESTSGSSYTTSSSADSFVKTDKLFEALVMQKDLGSKKVAHPVKDFFSQGKVGVFHPKADSRASREGDLLKIYYDKRKNVADVTMDHASIDYINELTRTEDQQYELLDEVKDVLHVLKEQGINIHEAVLDDVTRKLIAEADEMIHHCIISYLHRTLIDEKLLPMLDLNEPPESSFYGIPNAVALQLVAMDKNYQIRMLDLLEGAFLNFPNREYCVITTELSAKELPWMKHFVRVMPKKSSLFPRSLYVIHKIMFKSKLRIRRATVADSNSIIILIESLYESKKIMTDYETSVGGYCNTKCLSCFVTEVLSHESVPIIGLVIVSPESRSAKYQVNYDLDHYTYYDIHDQDAHAYVHHFVMSPLFQPYTKTVLKEVMRLMKTECLYHAVYPAFMDEKIVGSQTLLNNMEDWIALSPRRRIEYSMLNLTDIYDDQRQPPKYAQNYIHPHSALHFAKKFIFESKTAINTRIVFIGASDTAIACLEKLICRSNMDFKNITMISTHGLPGALPPDEIRDIFFPRRNNPALPMRHDEEWHQRLGFRAYVNVVYGQAIKIFRKIKVVVVNDRKVVPYDVLIITCGRQFVRPDCPYPEITDESLTKFKQTTSHNYENARRRIRKVHPIKPMKRLTPKPKNVFLINTDLDAVQALNYLRSFTPYISKRQIIVHGACLEAYCCIRALLELGIDTHRIVVITTPGDEMAWEKHHPYRDTAKLREIMTETLTQLGIQVISGYTFRRWNLQKISGLCTRINFASTTGQHPRISVSCFAYFSFCVRRIGDEIANAMINSFIAYNDGILINTKFETSDPDILAAGPAAVYEKKLCAEEFNHSYFCSYEVGRTLADFLLKKIIPPTNVFRSNIVDPAQPSLPPLFSEPLVVYADLPGHWCYMYLRRPGWNPSCCHEECTCEDCECGTEIITGSTKSSEDRHQKYFKLFLNSFQRVELIECVSRVKFPPSCFTALYGHHETFLKKLLESVAKGEVRDLYDYFCQPWIAALCQDRWINFREEIQELFANYQIGLEIKISNFIRDYLDNLDNDDSFQVDANILRHIFETTGLQGAVESKFLEFLKYNRSTLPMYARPDFVLEMYEERRSSSLYLPQVKNFVE